MKFPAMIALAAAVLFAASGPVLAETSQQSRMKDCSAQAKGKTGAERKAFMKSCLSGAKAAAPAPAAATPAAEAKAPAAAPGMSKSGKPLTAQQQKMKDCNAEATGKKGLERKVFMKECLKKK
ncbi:MAG: PsiF family protein [Thiobacillaceae bacterium]